MPLFFLVRSTRFLCFLPPTVPVFLLLLSSSCCFSFFLIICLLYRILLVLFLSSFWISVPLSFCFFLLHCFYFFSFLLPKLYCFSSSPALPSFSYSCWLADCSLSSSTGVVYIAMTDWFSRLARSPTNQYFVAMKVGPSVFVTFTTCKSMTLVILRSPLWYWLSPTFSVLSQQFYV